MELEVGVALTSEKLGPGQLPRHDHLVADAVGPRKLAHDRRGRVGLGLGLGLAAAGLLRVIQDLVEVFHVPARGEQVNVALAFGGRRVVEAKPALFADGLDHVGHDAAARAHGRACRPGALRKS